MGIISSFWRLPGSGKLFMAETEKSSCLVAMGAFLCLLGASQNAGAVNYFNWGADSPTTPTGTCTFIDAAIDPTGGHDGTGAMKYTVPDGADGQRGCTNLQNGSIGAGTWLSGKTLYYRWWMKIDPSFSWGDRKIFKLARLEDAGTDLLTFYMQNDGIKIESSSAGIGCSGGVCGTINYAFDGAAAKNYQEYILALRLQTSSSGTGALTLFVNAVQVGSFTHQLYTCGLGCGDVQVATWGQAMAQALYSQLCIGGTACGAGGNIWADDFSVDDLWNSKISGSPLNQPPPPANLRVQ